MIETEMPSLIFISFFIIDHIMILNRVGRYHGEEEEEEEETTTT
jgi:hypothetical protein